MAPDSRARILIVDDDRPIRDLLATVLEEAGYDTTQAFNGRHAVEMLSDARPDLILCDMMMPIMTGIELCQYVKEHSDIPVILMSSGMTGPEATDHDAFISKPFDLGLLESLIAAVLNGSTPAGQVLAEDG
jgi:two-component system OmpR family response regulator